MPEYLRNDEDRLPVPCIIGAAAQSMVPKIRPMPRPTQVASTPTRA